MLTEQKRETQERAYGTYERNSTIRFLVDLGMLTQCQLARAFRMKRQRVNQIVRKDENR